MHSVRLASIFVIVGSALVALALQYDPSRG